MENAAFDRAFTNGYYQVGIAMKQNRIKIKQIWLF
jgi:hypothetical protein